MDDYDQLAAARRIPLLQPQQLPVGGGYTRDSQRIALGLFVEQHQCERGAGGRELQVLMPPVSAYAPGKRSYGSTCRAGFAPPSGAECRLHFVQARGAQATLSQPSL